MNIRMVSIVFIEVCHISLMCCYVAAQKIIASSFPLPLHTPIVFFSYFFPFPSDLHLLKHTSFWFSRILIVKFWVGVSNVLWFSDISVVTSLSGHVSNDISLSISRYVCHNRFCITNCDQNDQCWYLCEALQRIQLVMSNKLWHDNSYDIDILWATAQCQYKSATVAVMKTLITINRVSMHVLSISFNEILCEFFIVLLFHFLLHTTWKNQYIPPSHKNNIFVSFLLLLILFSW